MAFELPKLNYAFNALEPHIDARTMEIHHGKHHQAYVTNLNNAIAGTDAEKMSIEEICKSISKFPMAVRNNGGGHFNHTLFWEIMSPKGGGVPSNEIGKAIESELGGFDKFKTDFTQAGATRFGSGWAWLCVKADGKLCVCSSPNQDNPLMDISECKGTPILGMDVWEHAYYLNYQNRRPDYMTAFFNVIDWNKVNENYLKAKK
ncbi:MAG TPA: superoxide dismutase [Bacteroidia bacterium]|nr:superoxide dismutase [Bacteroidia bacterium]